MKFWDFSNLANIKLAEAQFIVILASLQHALFSANRFG